MWGAVCYSTVGHIGGPDKWARWASRVKKVRGSGSQGKEISGLEEAQADVHPPPPPLPASLAMGGVTGQHLCQGSSCSKFNSRPLGGVGRNE